MGSLHTFFLSENTNLCVHLSCSENTSSLRTAYRSQRLFMRCIKKVISHPLRRPSSQNRDRFAGSRFCFLIWRLIHRAPNRIGDAFLIHLRFMFLIRLDRRFPGHTRLSEQSAGAVAGRACGTSGHFHDPHEPHRDRQHQAEPTGICRHCGRAGCVRRCAAVRRARIWQNGQHTADFGRAQPLYSVASTSPRQHSHRRQTGDGQTFRLIFPPHTGSDPNCGMTPAPCPFRFAKGRGLFFLFKNKESPGRRSKGRRL